jgi:hypothetical protein
MDNQTKLDVAITYLRSRNIYIVDPGNKFVPTPVANTDVAATMRRYLLQVKGVSPFREVIAK